MTIRSLPPIEAFDAGENESRLDWDAPLSARERWTPVRSALADDDRTLNITDELGDRGDGRGVTVGYVRGALKRMGKGDIRVNINSPGGDYFAGLAIYNLLREHEGKVITNIMGVAASAASVVAMASDELRIAKAGFLMIHNAWSIAIGNKNDMREVAAVLEQFDSIMAGVYSDRSGVAKDKIAAYMDAETYFAGEDAVKLGFADGLLASDEVKPDEEPAPVAAMRLADLALAKDGVPRRERRAILSSLTGNTPRAVADATPRAGDIATAAILQSVISQLKS